MRVRLLLVDVRLLRVLWEFISELPKYRGNVKETLLLLVVFVQLVYKLKLFTDFQKGTRFELCRIKPISLKRAADRFLSGKSVKSC